MRQKAALITGITGQDGAYLAELLLEKAVVFKPDDGELRLKYATILRKKQKFAKTMEQVNILCAKHPDNLSYQAQKASVFSGTERTLPKSVLASVLAKTERT